MATPIFNFEKTIQSMLYVCENIKPKDFHRIFKILYFADREHLSKYGRTITGDTYIKMAAGPVPTKLYDIFKAIRGDSYFKAEGIKDYFTVHDVYFVKPEKKADLRFLSKTDISELNNSISKYGQLPFETLTKISHDIAWSLAKDNGEIAIENILREIGEDEEYISYVSDFMNCQKAMY